MSFYGELSIYVGDARFVRPQLEINTLQADAQTVRPYNLVKLES